MSGNAAEFTYSYNSKSPLKWTARGSNKPYSGYFPKSPGWSSTLGRPDEKFEWIGFRCVTDQQKH